MRIYRHTWRELLSFSPPGWRYPVVKDFSPGVGYCNAHVLSFTFLFGIWRNPRVLYWEQGEIRNIRGTTTGMYDEMRASSLTGNLVSPITNVVSKCVSAQWYYRTSMIAFTSVLLELSHIRCVKWRKRCMAFIRAVRWNSSDMKFSFWEITDREWVSRIMKGPAILFYSLIFL